MFKSVSKYKLETLFTNKGYIILLEYLNCKHFVGFQIIQFCVDFFQMDLSNANELIFLLFLLFIKKNYFLNQIEINQLNPKLDVEEYYNF
jgi:hypothetical protein